MQKENQNDKGETHEKNLQNKKCEEKEDDYLDDKPQKKIKLNEGVALSKSALQFKILKTQGKARSSILTLHHGDVFTPVYMPVGTKGSIKGLTSKQMSDLNCQILLGNTYHLGFQPGGDFLEQCGGLHTFMNWKNNILTDSGGFQMVSLSKLCEITENGVTFESPVDKSKMLLRPEDSMKIQNQIGADIMMALDDVVKTTTQGPRMQEAQERTFRWMERNIVAHKKPHIQNLFPIIQGGLDFNLRKKSLEELIKLDAPGYAIGGLAGGEDKSEFWRIVDFCTEYLPKDKPRYLMGVGYPVDLVVCSCLGVDMFDCVFSTRVARFGTCFTKYGFIRINHQEFVEDLTPIEKDCKCLTCLNYTKSYLNFIIKEQVNCHLLSIHNLFYLFNLMKSIRKAIEDQKLEEFVNEFLQNQFINEKQIPQWVLDAMIKAKITINIYNAVETIK